jgi:hypothetical protein
MRHVHDDPIDPTSIAHDSSGADVLALSPQEIAALEWDGEQARMSRPDIDRVQQAAKAYVAFRPAKAQAALLAMAGADSRFTEGHLRLLIGIAVSIYGQSGVAWRQYEALAEYADIEVKTARNHCSELEAWGYIVRTDPRRSNIKGQPKRMDISVRPAGLPSWGDLDSIIRDWSRLVQHRNKLIEPDSSRPSIEAHLPEHNECPGSGDVDNGNVPQSGTLGSGTSRAAGHSFRECPWPGDVQPNTLYNYSTERLSTDTTTTTTTGGGGGRPSTSSEGEHVDKKPAADARIPDSADRVAVQPKFRDAVVTAIREWTPRRSPSNSDQALNSFYGSMKEPSVDAFEAIILTLHADWKAGTVRAPLSVIGHRIANSSLGSRDAAALEATSEGRFNPRDKLGTIAFNPIAGLQGNELLDAVPGTTPQMVRKIITGLNHDWRQQVRRSLTQVMDELKCRLQDELTGHPQMLDVIPGPPEAKYSHELDAQLQYQRRQVDEMARGWQKDTR